MCISVNVSQRFAPFDADQARAHINSGRVELPVLFTDKLLKFNALSY